MADEAEVKTEAQAEVTSTKVAEESESVENGNHTEDYQKLIDYGINAKVADELDVIYKSGKLLSLIQ